MVPQKIVKVDECVGELANSKKEKEDTECENLTSLRTGNFWSQDEKIVAPSIDENVQRGEENVQWYETNGK